MALVTPFDLPELAGSISALPGVGPATARALAARGIRTWGEALFLLPVRYQDRRRPTPIARLEPGRLAVVRGRIVSSGRWGRGGRLWRMVIEDHSGRLGCVWFRFKRAFLEEFRPGQEVYAVGEPTPAKGGGNLPPLQMAHPELYPAQSVGPDHPSLGRVVPVYPAVEGVRPGHLRRVMAELVRRTAQRIPDPLAGLLPPELYPLPVGEALARAHQPPPQATEQDLDPQRSPWRRTLAVNELAYFELALALLRRQRSQAPARPLAPEGKLLARFLDALPFSLTPGQQQAIQAIRRDLARPHPMARLLAGDVGTGKTVVAAAAVCLAVEAGVQTALMAPTEVLARQHHRTLRAWLEPLGVEVALLTGSQSDPQATDAPVVVGTHALISRRAALPRLGLAVIDEQHRFGVEQRLALRAKGHNPHLLVLSATPIPRTLALALAGHLELSDLPQRPVNRRPVHTELVPYPQRRQAVEAMAAAVRRGEQVYVICPLVEASPALEAQDVVTTHRNLARYFPEVEVGLLHGRMEAREQQAALEDFARGRSRILVATTVVEVGVDVPAATLMVVLGAERFGLSQLHQLRGRVGRGNKPGRCLLVPGPEPGELALERLTVLCQTHDGRRIAEADLMLRGPGEALGRRQAGLPPFRVARWSRDAELIPQLRRIIQGWLQEDPELASPRYAAVKKECLRRWGRRLGLAGAD